MSKLGQGTYGSVYQVGGIAQKVFDGSFDLLEMIISKTFDHPSLYKCSKVDIRVEEAKVMLTMNFELLEKIHTLTPEILRDLLEGMSYLYSRNILHLDISGKNVMRKGSRGLLIDFGMSRQMTDSKFVSDCKWVADSFRAPECTNMYTIKSEIWSFGVMIFSLNPIWLIFRI
jgi:serine/threonine protein kinase